MKNLKLFISCLIICIVFIAASCDDRPANTSAKDEQAHTEMNQANLNRIQPPPTVSWSLERENLIKRTKLQNERSIMFYMYLFIEGVADPIGYYEVNKVSSVNSQLTNPSQIVNGVSGGSSLSVVLPSPAEDGSYGTNGDAVFGFTAEDIYIEHNMHYVVSTVPLSFKNKVTLLTIIDIKTKEDLKQLMSKIK